MGQQAIVQRLCDEEEPAGASCKHHWLIEPPTGPASRGECRHCGAERIFMNSTYESVSNDKT